MNRGDYKLLRLGETELLRNINEFQVCLWKLRNAIIV